MSSATAAPLSSRGLYGQDSDPIMTPPTLNAPVSDRSPVDEAIVVSADALFSAEGVTAVDLDRVAAQARVTGAQLRVVYPTKRKLVVAAFRYRHQDWMGGLRTAESALADPRDQILTVFSYLESCFADRGYRGCAFINGYGELGRLDSLMRDLADGHLREVEQHVAMLCDAAGLPSHLADALSLLVQGAQVEAAIHRTVQPARSARAAAAMLMSLYDTGAGQF
jgi:AcrR family transcriptional regulator